MTDDFRCSLASAADDEPLAGTAVTATELLLVEAPGPWGRDALTENRLPEAVRAHLTGLSGTKVLLVRRYGGDGGPGTRVFHARREGGRFVVTSTVLDRPEDVLALDLADLAPYDGPLWLVCTNGRRDLCCADVGRAVAGELVREWPEGTWETTHLGGHRFAGTLLALPSGLSLGRLTPGDAVGACRALERGEVPLELCRGRAGSSGEEQVRELHLMAGGSPDVEVVAVPGPVRRQSCGDLKTKPTTRFEIRPR
jgi:hypothetical protein